MNRSRLSALIPLLTLLASCSMFGVDEDAADAPAPLPEVTKGDQLAALWSRDLGERFVSAPGALKLVSAEGKLGLAIGHSIHLIDPESGETVWQAKVDEEFTAGPGIGDGLVAAVDNNGDLLAFDLTSGEKLWQAAVKREVLTSPLVAQGKVVVRTVDGQVMAFSTDQGTMTWRFRKNVPALSLHGSSGLVLINNQEGFLTGFGSGKLVASNLISGQILWEASVSEQRGRNEIERLTDIDTTPVVMGDTLYVASYQGGIVSFSLSQRKVHWNTPVSLFQEIAVDKNQLYATDEKGRVVSLSRDKGEILWSQEGLLNRGVTAPEIHGDFIVVGDSEGYLHLLDSQSGHFVGQFDLSGSALLKLLSVGKRLYLLSEDGILQALSDTASQN